MFPCILAVLLSWQLHSVLPTVWELPPTLQTGVSLSHQRPPPPTPPRAACAATEAHHFLCVGVAAGPGSAAGAGGGGPQGTYLTLRRLQLWLAEPLRRMRLLAALVDAAHGCVGGQLAGRVWVASKVGDPLARGYATRILQQVRGRGGQQTENKGKTVHSCFRGAGGSCTSWAYARVLYVTSYKSSAVGGRFHLQAHQQAA